MTYIVCIIFIGIICDVGFSASVGGIQIKACEQNVHERELTLVPGGYFLLLFDTWDLPSISCECNIAPKDESTFVSIKPMLQILGTFDCPGLAHCDYLNYTTCTDDMRCTQENFGSSGDMAARFNSEQFPSENIKFHTIAFHLMFHNSPDDGAPMAIMQISSTDVEQDQLLNVECGIPEPYRNITRATQPPFTTTTTQTTTSKGTTSETVDSPAGTRTSTSTPTTTTTTTTSTTTSTTTTAPTAPPLTPTFELASHTEDSQYSVLVIAGISAALIILGVCIIISAILCCVCNSRKKLASSNGVVTSGVAPNAYSGTPVHYTTDGAGLAMAQIQPQGLNDDAASLPPSYTAAMREKAEHPPLGEDTFKQSGS